MEDVYKRQDNKVLNFYEATSVKDNNTEVIWARDYKYPGQTVEFTKYNIPKSHAEDIDNSYGGPVLNLVEAYELLDTDTPGTDSKVVTSENGTFKFYDSSDAPFKDRDPRLWGTILYPGAELKSCLLYTSGCPSWKKTCGMFPMAMPYGKGWRSV